MTVKELIEALGEFDSSLPVLISIDDQSALVSPAKQPEAGEYEPDEQRPEELGRMVFEDEEDYTGGVACVVLEPEDRG
jgi:hypothetical protein